ncbi:hypothetical protein GGX14DRAFT_450186 [Mycena pura]|uniref:Uncharacterized protein n=1 Tax=Mycena pura TaxID=153505 RepID=A0AAD6VFJ7_9AGAR|nr:hypothetical protein GGX14DRAFT_450186 [Mycena pura]
MPGVMRSGSPTHCSTTSSGNSSLENLAPTGWSTKSASTSWSNNSTTRKSGNRARSAIRWWSVERRLPTNIKSQLRRSFHRRSKSIQIRPPNTAIAGSATGRQPRTVQPQELGTITETLPVSQKPSEFRRRDSKIRTTDPNDARRPKSSADSHKSLPWTSTPDPGISSHEQKGDVPKKPSQTQINALAKRLRALEDNLKSSADAQISLPTSKDEISMTDFNESSHVRKTPRKTRFNTLAKVLSALRRSD